MPSNQAAYFTSKGEKPLVVREAPYTSPGPNEVTIKVHAFAVNPVDNAQQETGLFIKDYPYIIGCDISGVIEELGTNVNNFKVGDRVFGMASQSVEVAADGTPVMGGTPKGAGAHQLYSVVRAMYVGKIPDSMSFEEGSVLALGLLTAASGLYLPIYLGLKYPSLDVKQGDEYLLVWGGASSVGSNAIQLALNSGYRVITTCSTKNAAYCENLGAEKAFDYNSETVINDLVEFMKGKQIVGIFDAISRFGTVEKCVEVAHKSGTKKVATVVPGTESGHTPDVDVTGVFMHMKEEEAPKILAEYMPKALEIGRYKAKPDPLVVGTGLGNAQKALDTAKAGVSAKKVVVSL